MLSKIMSYVLGFVMILLVIGIGLHYYVSQPIESKELMCHKGKLLHRIGDDGTVYLKVKGMFCELDKGMIIIEEQL